jgi:hypothetical protein
VIRTLAMEAELVISVSDCSHDSVENFYMSSDYSLYIRAFLSAFYLAQLWSHLDFELRIAYDRAHCLIHRSYPPATSSYTLCLACIADFH